MTECPFCRNHRLGRLSENRYYCADCAMELIVKGSQVSGYPILEDGEISSTALKTSSILPNDCVDNSGRNPL